MNSAQFKRWLAREGSTFEKAKGSHLTVRHGDRSAILPMHGGRKQLGRGLIEVIKKQLGLK